MKQSKLADKLATMDKDISAIINTVSDSLDTLFQPTSKDNQQTAHEGDMHLAMIDYVVASALNSRFKKFYDGAKKALDYHVEINGTDPSGKAGQTINLHENNVFSFTKRQNKDGETTLVVDLVTALARAGVEKSVVDAAIKSATKPIRGYVYYDVKTVEE